MICVSATPGERELRHLAEVTEQNIPAGLEHVPSGGGAIDSDVKKKSSASMKVTLREIDGVVRMEIRPTGLLDPRIEVRPTEGQVQDLLDEINQCVENNERDISHSIDYQIRRRSCRLSSTHGSQSPLSPQRNWNNREI